ncbi:MAG: ABC transporter permease, partial [Alistipes sp.]|nr:ABC transporter permease [Alistipes sp.]
MSLFRSFVRKEILHILRDPRTMLILLGMPVVQILLFGFAISVEIRGINLAIVAPVQSETLRQITAKIEANPYFTVVAPAATAVEAESLLRNGTVDLVLRFPPDSDARLAHADATAQLSVDASNPNTAVAEQLYLQQIVAGYFASQSYVHVATAPAIQPNLHLLYNPRMESAYNFVPGILGLILILICAMMTSVSIVREKEVGTMEVLLVSPVRPLTLILSKMVPYFLLSCASLSLILLLSRFVLHVPLAGSLWGICALSLLYILLSLALGLLISTLVRTQMAAML